jgi:hypothetical protein
MPVSAAANCEASWNGARVFVRSRVVGRYAWMTATIDVTVDDIVVLRTGGVLKAVGRSAEAFEFRGSSHTAEINWGLGWGPSFPFDLKMDGTSIKKSRVPVENWYFAYWPFLAALGLLVVRRLWR